MPGRSQQEGPTPAKQLLAISILIAGYTFVFTAPPTTGRPQAPSETVTSILVEVPVQVKRNGEPVRGLTRGDFELWDEGRRQEILTVDFYDYSLEAADGRTEPDPSMPPAARRHILLLFDLTFSSVPSLNSSRNAAVDIVLRSTHPDDLIGVGTYSDMSGAQLALSFTSDRSQVIAAIDAIGAPQLQGRYVDSLGLMSAKPDQSSGRGAVADAQIREIMELTSRFEKQTSDRAQVGNLANAFTALAQVLGSVAGRKHVVYLSEGFDNEAISSTEDFVETARMNQAAEKGEFWKIDSQARYGDTTRGSFLDRMTDALQRADCVVHSVDLQRPDLAESIDDGDPSARAGGNQGLSLLASETGGSYTRNVSDVDAAMSRVLNDVSVTYVLSYRPSDLESDGAYHKLKVRLAKGVEKARLTHRPGYFAPSPGAKRSPAERRLELTEMLMAGGDHGSIPVSTIAVPFAQRGDVFYVPMFIEIDGPILLAGRNTGRIETHILVYAFDREGTVRDLFNHKVGLELDQVGDALNRRGLKMFGSLYLRPDTYDVRVLVVEESTGRSQVHSVRVEILDSAAPTMQVLPPFVPDPLGLWVLTREPATGKGQASEPYPFQFGEQPFVPAATPTVPSTGTTPLIVMTRGAVGSASSLQVRLRDASGRLLDELSHTPPRTANVLASGGGAIATEIRTKGLDRGHCMLEVTLDDEQGESSTATIPCVIGPPGGAAG